MLVPFQNIIFHPSKFGTSSTAFFVGEKFTFDPIRHIITVEKDTEFKFSGFYNTVSLSLLQDSLEFERLFLNCSIAGHALVQIIHVNQFCSEFCIAEKEINDSRATTVLSLSSKTIEELGVGYLYLKIIALTQVQISSANFQLETNRKNDATLGICITHFNRKRYVINAVNRIGKFLSQDAYYKDKVKICVVDNSQNLEPADFNYIDNLTIIKNHNSGGTGGFMRGFLHFKNEEPTSHVLFMDDDGSCEIESVRRVVNIFSLSKKSALALAATLLFEERPNTVLEKGGFYKEFCRPRFAEYDITRTESLVQMEVMHLPLNYGAWCFFSFPVSEVKKLSFPFFVRGDDILFGLMNKFDIVCPNGIACYATDFALKVSPFSIYMDTRSHLINTFLTQDSKLPILRIYARFFLTSLFSHQYDRVNCIRVAKKNVTEMNKEFWSEEFDMFNVRKTLVRLTKNDQPKILNLNDIHYIYPLGMEESKLKKFFRVLTLNLLD